MNPLLFFSSAIGALIGAGVGGWWGVLFGLLIGLGAGFAVMKRLQNEPLDITDAAYYERRMDTPEVRATVAEVEAYNRLNGNDDGGKPGPAEETAERVVVLRSEIAELRERIKALEAELAAARSASVLPAAAPASAPLSTETGAPAPKLLW